MTEFLRKKRAGNYFPAQLLSGIDKEREEMQMISPVSVMKMLGERKIFIKNHPEFFGFIVSAFGRKMDAGTVIEVKVTRPGAEPEMAKVEVQKSELKLFEALQDVMS